MYIRTYKYLACQLSSFWNLIHAPFAHLLALRSRIQPVQIWQEHKGKYMLHT